ncbi:MAG: hypothetical protein HYT87_13635 [Nitrospirae bacterium]|nr:hypothetical protein [Nitrospirota bacterium]
MARTKKTSTRAGKTSTPKARARRSTAPGRLLSVAEIQRLLKPPENFEELADKAIEAWNRVRANVRIPGMSPGALAGLVKRARQRQTVEAALREGLELTLKRAQHARLIADDAAWKGVLKIWRFVKPVASENEQVKNAFLFLADALSRPRAEAEKQLAAQSPHDNSNRRPRSTAEGDAEPKAETHPEATQTQQ